MKKKISTIIFMLSSISGCNILTLKVDSYSEPNVKPMNGMWVVVEDLNFNFFEKNNPDNDYTIIVPAGFVTDLASIPEPLRAIFGEYHKFDAAGIVHDYLYWAQPCEQEGNGKRIADKIYRDTMKNHGDISFQNRWTQWFGLKAGGGQIAWKNNKHRKKTESRFMPEEYRKEINDKTNWSDIRNDCCSDHQIWELTPPDKEICKIKPEDNN